MPDAWNEELRTGHEMIDREHREFLRQLDELKTALDTGAGRERMVDLITILQKYVLGHFAREEAYMREVGCPTLEQNMAAHREFVGRFDRWIDFLTTHGMPVSILRDVHRESLAWINGHIVHIDCGLRGCRSLAEGTGRPPSNPPLSS